jgi:lipoteichoic acid synthase
MMAAGLLLVFILAKLFVLTSHMPSWSLWTPIAYFWQDVLVSLPILIAGAVLRARRVKTRAHWLLYWMLVIYVALNIPVGRVLFTPITLPMLRATRGALVDSLLIHLTWTNALFISLVVGAGTLPCLVGEASARRPALKRALVAAALATIGLGPAASRHVDTFGLDRNVLAALVSSAFPHVTARAAANDWRVSPFGAGRPEDLSSVRGLARNRNVVLISLESTAAQYLGLYGASIDPTPNLTRLASNAIVFDNAYSVYPESIKGLFSILCAIFPAFDSSPELYGQVSCPTVPATLANAGYRTALFHSGRFGYLGMESIVRNRGYQLLADAGAIGGSRNSSFGVDEPSTVDRMLSWIDSRPRTEPFLLTYLPIAGHHPYESPEGGPFSNADDLGRYLNALNYGDAALGAFVEGLRRRGLQDHTLWIIMGDHGEAFGQHPGNFGHTFFLYDENVRVPFLVAAPGALIGQTRVRKTVSLVDTAPTILDLMGIPAPAVYQGRSMLDDSQRMALFFADYSLGLVGLRDGPWKFIHELESKRDRLFNLERDPFERTDISGDHLERAAWYRQDLLGWSAAQKDRLTATVTSVD